MNFQVGDLLRYEQSKNIHANRPHMISYCVVLEADSVMGKVFWLENQYEQYLSWVSIYGSFEKVK